MRPLVFFGIYFIFCVHCNNSTTTTTSQVLQSFNGGSSGFNPGNSWDGFWNYGFNPGPNNNLQLARDGYVNFAEDLTDSGGSQQAGIANQAPGTGGSSYYPPNQAGSIGNNNVYPAASNSHGYYSPGVLPTGWNMAKPNTALSGHKGLEHILEGMNLEHEALGVLGPTAAILGIGGIKGALALVKLGLVFLIAIVSLLLVITVPLSSLLVIIILSIPIPTWGNKVRNIQRSITKGSETYLKEVILADECLERIICTLNKASKEYDSGYLAKRFINSAKTWKTSWSKRIDRGVSQDKLKCEEFRCSPKPFLKFFKLAT